MKDGKFETQAEIYQALLDGKKIRRETWLKGLYTYIYILNGVLTDDYGHDMSKTIFYPPQEFLIYEEPKPKKKITLYTHIVKYVLQEDVYETLRPTTRNAEDIEKNMVGVKVVSTTCKEVEVDDV